MNKYLRNCFEILFEHEFIKEYGEDFYFTLESLLLDTSVKVFPYNKKGNEEANDWVKEQISKNKTCHLTSDDPDQINLFAIPNEYSLLYKYMRKFNLDIGYDLKIDHLEWEE